MRKFTTWAMALVVAAVFVPTVSAEETVVPHGTTMKLILLRQKSVQDELKITPDEKKKIHDFTDKQHDAFLASRKAGGEGMAKKHEAMEIENAKFLKDTLTNEQIKRLDQISLQFGALHHLLTPEAATGLKLSEEQIGKLRAVQQAHHKMFDQHIGAKLSKEARHEKFTALRKDTKTQIEAILNDAQKAKLQQMAGAPFTGEIVFEEFKD